MGCMVKEGEGGEEGGMRGEEGEGVGGGGRKEWGEEGASLPIVFVWAPPCKKCLVILLEEHPPSFL